MRIIGLTILLSLCCLNSYAADRYWVAASTGNWSNTANWSTTAGGAGGSSVPSTTDRAIFNFGGAGDCTVDVAVAIQDLTVNSSYLGDVTVGAFSFSATGTVAIGGSSFTGTSIFTVNSAAGAFSISGGALMNMPVDVSAATVALSGGTFNFDATFNQTGSTSINGSGANTYQANFTLENSGTSFIRTATVNPDTYNGNVTLNLTGSGDMFFCQNAAGSTIAGNFNVNNLGTGAGSDLYVCTNAGSGITVTGNTVVVANTSGSSGNTFIGAAGTVTLNSGLTYSNTSTGNSHTAYVASGTGGSVVINGTTDIFNSGAGGTKRFILGNNGAITFNGDLEIENNATAGTSNVDCHRGAASVNAYNGNIIIESNNNTCDGVTFGLAGGSGTLSTGNQISIGAGGFQALNISLRNFTQLGVTAQTLVPVGPTTITVTDSDWEGDVNFTSARMSTNGTTYGGTAYLEKNGPSGGDNSGGNTFVGNTTLVNSGGNQFRFGSTNSDDFQSDLTVNITGTSSVIIARNSTGNTIGGSFTVNNAGSSGAVITVADGATSSLTVTGVTTITSTTSGPGSTNTIGNSGDITFNNDVTVINNSTATNGRITLVNGVDSEVTINGNSIFQNLGSTGTTRIVACQSGILNCNGTVTALNHTTGGSGQMYFARSAGSAANINGNITMESFNASANGVQFGDQGGNVTLGATYTVNVGVGGFSEGTALFRNFTQVGATAQSVTLTANATLTNDASDWGGNVTFVSPNVFSDFATYRGTSYFEKTGASNNNSGGGNTYMGNSEWRHSGASGLLITAFTNPDAYQADVLVHNTGVNSRIYFDHASAGNTVNGSLNVLNVATGATHGVLVAGEASSSITIDGDLIATVNTTAGADTSQMIDGGTGIIQGNVVLNNLSSVAQQRLILGGDATSSVTVNGTTTLNNLGTSGLNRMGVARDGVAELNGDVFITNNSGSTDSELFLARQSSANIDFNGNITIEGTNANASSVNFGGNGGTSTLANGFTITIGASGYIGEILRINNMTQVGGTPQNVAPITGLTHFFMEDCDWGGNVDFRGVRFDVDNNIFRSTAHLEKTGAGTDIWSDANNTFMGDVTIENSGTGVLHPSFNNTNIFQANATYNQTNGFLQPVFNTITNYPGNLTVNGTSAVQFGAGGSGSNGRIVFSGTGAQTFTGTGATHIFRIVQTNNTADEITVLHPFIIRTELDLDFGHLMTSNTGLPIMNDNAIVSSVSNDAFVDGPIRKIGNDVFTFPVGDEPEGVYAPISISAPSNGTHHFTAEYHHINPDLIPYDRSLREPTLNNISACEYWILDRTNGSSNVDVTLSYENVRSCGVTNPANLRVARWDGAIWRDEGNGGTTGTAAAGTVVSSGAVTNFSPFTLASINGENPLPIELISFEAELNERVTELEWKTATETNNDYFEIEKSQDGITWEVFHNQEGAGNSQVEQNYQAFDLSPFEGVTYYRLKQVDFDGKYTYSDVRAVNMNGSNIVVYPNPVQDNLIIQGLETEDTYQVLGNDGRLVFSGNTSNVSTVNWASGVYILTVYDQLGHVKQQLKVIK